MSQTNGVWRYYSVEYAKELEFFRQCHRNGYNLIVHILSIPLELLSIILLLPHIDLVTYSSFAYCFIVGLYCSAVSSASIKILFVPLHVLIAFAAYKTKIYLGHYECAFFVGMLTQAVSWILQVIVGHWYFEENQPGMTKKLTIHSILISNALATETFTDFILDKR